MYEEIEINGNKFILKDDNKDNIIELSLPHQCDSWYIGDKILIEEFIEALQQVLVLIKEKEEGNNV